MSKQSKAKDTGTLTDMLFNCPKAGIEVHLKVEGEYTKGLFGGKKFISQTVKSCDLQNQGGCTVKLEPAINSKCPAVMKAEKLALK